MKRRAAGLPVLAALAFAAPPAALAQTNVKLVGNTGQAAITDSSTTPRDYAQKFTTGGNADGYRLTRVDIALDVAAGTSILPDYGMSIREENASGNPATTALGTMTAAAGLSTGTIRYDAPGGGIDLAANTTYFVMFSSTAWNNRRLVKVTGTGSDAEDTGAAAGWSIADSGRRRDSGGDADSWADNTGESYRIDVYGRATETVPPALSAAKVGVNGTSLLLVYDEPLNTTAPAASAFSVTVDGGTAVDPSSVAIAGSVVTLTLATAVTAGQMVTVTYTVPNTNPIQDPDGNEAAALTDEPVTIDTTGPTMTSAVVEGTTLTVTYDEPLDPSSLQSASFYTLVIVGDAADISIATTAASVSGSTVTVTLASAVTSAGMTVRAGYVAFESDTGQLTDLLGNRAITGTLPVTVVEAVAPVLSAATVDGTRLTLVYDERLDEGSVPAASAFSVTVASGTPAAPSSVVVTGPAVILTLATAVTTGQSVTVSYTAPTANPIQDRADPANAAAAFTDETVTETSADATLSALSLTDASDTDLPLEPATFSSSTYAYTATVANDVTSVKVTATLGDSAAALTASWALQGTTPQTISITSGTAVTLTGLNDGFNVLTVTVTAEDTVAKQDYTLTVIRRGPPSARILPVANTSIAAGTDLSLRGNGNDIDGGEVTAEWTAMTGGADVSSSVLSGFTSTPPEGDIFTYFTVTFNAATPGTYTVMLTVTDDEGETAARSVTVTVQSTDTMLNALAVTDGSDNAQTLTPAFAAAATAYTVTNAIQAAKVTATVNHAAATLAGSLSRDGAAGEPVTMTSATAATLSNLAVGANVLTITVTAESGATQAYTVTVTRTAAQDPTASISPSGMATVMTGENLMLTGSGADPDGGTVTYAWTVTDPSATDVTDDVFPDGMDAATAVFATDDTTAVGDYTVTLTVTDDEDATATAMLTVTVTNISTDATLMALAAMAGTDALTLSPAFAPATMDYTATVGADVTSVDVTATANHMAATLAGSLTRAGGMAEEVALTSGAAWTLADLPPGDSMLTITVTAEDTTTTQTYTLTIMRKVSPTVSVAPAGDQRVAPETDLMLTATAEDPDGLAAGASLTYAWTAVADPGNMATAQATVSGANTAMLTFNANEPGLWAVTVTVTDDESQTAMASLRVTVVLDTEMRAKAVTKVLAAAGVRTLSGALANVGARLGGIPGPSLTLAGENVPLGVGSSAADMACEPDVFGRHECAPDMRGASGLDLFSSSAFSLAAGAAGGEAMADPDAPRWAVWGRGDAGAFEGSPDGMRYDGKTLTGWLGVDARAGQWVAGVALSRGETEADYEFDAGGGETGAGSLETTLTSVYPYGRWTFDEGYEVRGLVGVGTGEARHRSKEEGAAEETSDLTMWMASAGVRRPLPPTAGIALAARGEVSLVQMETGDGEETIDGLSAQGWRGRAGVEGSQRFALPEGGSLEPFAEAGVRYDGGDGLEGSGVELAGGVRYDVERVHIEVRGRWLAAHTEEGAKEHGVSATVRLDADALRRGFSFALTPRWGSSASGSDALWKDDLPRPGSTAAAETAIDARLGYGVGMPRDALLTPFVETGFAEHRQYRVGARYEAQRALSLELSGERRERTAAEPEHAVGLDLRLRF